MSLVHRIKRRLSGEAKRNQHGVEQSAEWYDDAYSNPKTTYHEHYTQSIYYFIWTVIVDRTPETASVLEIGCGPGQLAAFLNDRGVAQYKGFDFSSQAIAMAKELVPSLEFHIADALTTDLLDDNDYDLVICTEVLEHIEADIEVLNRIRPGTRCIITVPNFPYPSHVRHFNNKIEVSDRYGKHFTSFRVNKFLKDPDKLCYFLLDGIKGEPIS
jgi:2-polyprenyl-3-methyl-5-hydroxy-6-metoxy-1,4-benzoquinol methylase